MTRIVVSRTLDHVDSPDILIQGDIAPQVSKLKAQPGRDLLLICGPELLAALAEHQLVDEFRILIKPSVLGRGFPLFGRLDKKLNLKLLSIRVFESGAVMHQFQVTYQRP
jgi:dihydrofolate reductase